MNHTLRQNLVRNYKLSTLLLCPRRNHHPLNPLTPQASAPIADRRLCTPISQLFTTSTPNLRAIKSKMAPTEGSKTPQPIVISGPSGSGKSTILKRLFEAHPNKFMFSVSHTTRNPRAGESHGEHYHFVTRPEFEELLAKDGFIEHAQFGGNLYGTSYATIADITKAGKIPILDIEMEGVKQIRKSHLDAKYLFLSPPSFEELEKRLRGRGTDAEEAIQKRLKQAKVEMEYSKTPGVHDKIVVNDDLDRAYAEVEAFCLQE